METLIQGGSYNEALVESIDAKAASWLALLPASKKDPLRMDGTIDEVMWAALSQAAMLVYQPNPDINISDSF
jgi:nicotinate-nucleotide pyrophosphorylase (carboxylating)